MEKETMVATVPQAEIVDEQQLSRDVTDIEFQAESLVIQTDEDYAFAGEFGKMLKKKASQVTTFFKPMKDSAYQAHKAVCDREKAMSESPESGVIDWCSQNGGSKEQEK